MTGGMTRTKAKRTRRAPAPPPAPAPVTLPPVLLRNNWSLRRAGLKGFRVEASFDGEALRVPATAIERMLVGYERARFDCTWRTIIWSPLTRRGLVLATSRRRDPGFVRLVEAVAWWQVIALINRPCPAMTPGDQATPAFANAKIGNTT